MKKALVLYSGGLDSRLVVRMLQDQDFQVTALYFALPFGCGCCNLSCNFNFTQKENVKMEIMDVNKEPLLSEYLEMLKNPKFGTGAGINPCKDCKIFMFKKAKEY
ncbi:MAG: tRNA (5-methylaminomethyl-2-thiouridylate)-methyltransferase, partial [Nanoarchaeota archaeon]|nr:tRNA (5-methylaminomethyl-2-thiouridylate)-methyltransferase [Nanoarchaeota archaeon]